MVTYDLVLHFILSFDQSVALRKEVSPNLHHLQNHQRDGAEGWEQEILNSGQDVIFRKRRRMDSCRLNIWRQKEMDTTKLRLSVKSDVPT
jgi:hypothetical protein